jgi:predicted DNA-binding WGR domain protein
MKQHQIVMNWRNVDLASNKRRWYHLHTSHDLWNRPIVICRWGRMDGQQQEQILWYANGDELRRIVHLKVRDRQHHGYILWPRDS